MNSDIARTIGFWVGLFLVLVGILVPWATGAFIMGRETLRFLRKQRPP